MKIGKNHVWISIVATLLLAGIFFLLNHFFDAGIWEGMKLSHTVADKEYCESMDMAALFRTRYNTWSNLCYFFLGMLAILEGIRDLRVKNSSHLVAGFPALSILFGLSLIYLCMGSSFFHASLTWMGQCVDMNAAFAVALSLLTISVYRMVNKPKLSTGIKIVFLFSFVAAVFAFIFLHLLISSFILLPAVMGLTTCVTLMNYSGNKSGFRISMASLSFVCLVAAYILRELDVAKTGCVPDFFLQGHSVWHLLTGLGAFLLYRFYKTEMPVKIILQ